MLRQDNFIVGFVAGVICTIVFYFVFVELNNVLMGTLLPEGNGFSPQFIAIMAVCTNLFPFLMFNAANKARSMQGIIGATIALAAVVIVIYRAEFF
ncbi:hypothetical protein BH09BAC1_BH09BAC1_27530 [soil metagenome]